MKRPQHISLDAKPPPAPVYVYAQSPGVTRCFMLTEPRQIKGA